MGVHSLKRGQLTRAAAQSLQATTIPAPTAGMDARQNLSDPAPKVCIYAYNIEPAEYGMRVRDGYREYQAGVDDGGSLGVRTIIPYAGDEVPDRLFCTNNEGIWDITTDGAAPVLMLAFPTATTGAAGYGVYTAFTSDAGDNILFYADRENGLFTFDPDLDTWAQTAGITGITITDVTYINVHKQRIWLAVQEDTTGYYLDVGAIAGAATPFYFGAKFKHGGELVALLNWTVDGGEGLDDYLVVVSRAGDVIPYQGDDPSLDAWQAVGTYFIGEIPAGNKISADFGGDLLILSEFGVTAMSDLLNASDTRSMASQSVAFKIASLLRADLQQFKYQNGWELRYAPTQGYLIINRPQIASYEYLQYVLIRTTEGWCFWRSVPMLCVDTWRGKTVFGTVDNTVEVMDVEFDDVGNDGENGEPIAFSLLTNYSSLDAQAQFKRGELVRPTFIGEIKPTYRTKLFYDFKIKQILPPSDSPVEETNLWDVGLWDQALWDEGGNTTTWAARGGLGIGRSIAVSLNGYANSALILVNFDLMWRTGGVL